VLTLLLQCPGEIVSRDELRQKLWPEGTYVDFDGSLNVILKKLRAAIDDDSDNPRFIETVPRRGYRFIAPVSTSAAEPAPSAPVKAAVPEPAVLPEVPRPEVASITAPLPLSRVGPAIQIRSRRFVYLTSAVAVIAVAITAGFLWQGKSSVIQRTSAAAPVLMRKSIAVLGFHNVSGRPGDAWLGTAFSEMLSTELAGGEKLRLVSAEDVANLSLSAPWSQTDTLDQKTTSRIGSALNSDLLVLGSYMTVGNLDRGRLRLDVRMQDAKTGEILTEIAEVGSAQDLFPMVGRVGDKLRDRLDIPALEGSDEAAVFASLPRDRDAARFYARGLVKMREFDALAAKDLFAEASKSDPGFSLAHLMLARAWNQLGYEQKRKDEAKKALDLSSDLPRTARMLVQGEYYASLADHEKAASTYRSLFELFPDSVEYGLLLAGAQTAAGHTSQASYTISRVRALPPPASDDPRIDLADARASAHDDPARLVLIRSALQKASAQGNKMIFAQARKEECMNLIYSKHPEQGPPSCEDAYNIYLAAGNRLGAADAIRLMGDYEGGQGHRDQAIAMYQKAFSILRELGEHYKTGAVLNNMAIDYVNEGNIDRGEQLYRQAKFHFEQAGDKALTALTIGNIADILYLRGDLGGATRLYQQALEIEDTLDHGSPGYLLYRLSDVDLLQGDVQDAHRLVQRAIDVLRPNHGGFGYLTGAMLVMGEVLKAEGNVSGARKQFEEALSINQEMGAANGVGEVQEEIADLDTDEGHGDAAETLLRPAILEFEKEKADPDIISAYTSLSHALLVEGKVDEARKAIAHAVEVNRSNSDAMLKLGVAIQNSRMEIANVQDPNAGISAARLQLHASIATAKRLGYYGLECEARLALGELEAKMNPVLAKTQLTALASETRSHGLELLARQAEQAMASAGTSISASNRPVH
jgi:DNA-binding winged helix-turn-helix (wHTH) protein/tetratricopeptide (TPR) repeat protein